MINVLIADDDAQMRTYIKEALNSEEYNFIEFNPLTSIETIPRLSVDVALIDICMPRIDGFELRKELIKKNPLMEVIFISGGEDESLPVQAFEEGGHSFLTKPISAFQLRSSFKAAIHIRNLKSDITISDNNCICGSDHINKPCYHPVNIKNQISTYGPLSVPVLITGESGSGKEVVAECLHKHSLKKDNKLISLNCAALSSTLIESELFGHEAGSFTGASKEKHGYFEVAKDGTLFLDEVGELPLELQAKLLRVLDKKEFVPVGSTSIKKTNARIISATNRDLTKMVVDGSFRSDLYYRLHGVNIFLKPLREQVERIPFLTSLFFEDSTISLSEEALKHMSVLPWRGNIRELKTVCEILKATCNKLITKEDVVALTGEINKVKKKSKDPRTYKEFKDTVMAPKEKIFFNKLLKESRGNISKVARVSGLSRRYLYDKLKDLDLL